MSSADSFIGMQAGDIIWDANDSHQYLFPMSMIVDHALFLDWLETKYKLTPQGYQHFDFDIPDVDLRSFEFEMHTQHFTVWFHQHFGHLIVRDFIEGELELTLEPHSIIGFKSLPT